MLKMKLNFLLFKNSITQKELSEKTGINKNTIHRYCNNSCATINREHVAILCQFFHCGLNDILELELPNTTEKESLLQLYHNLNKSFNSECSDSIAFNISKPFLKRNSTSEEFQKNSKMIIKILQVLNECK